MKKTLILVFLLLFSFSVQALDSSVDVSITLNDKGGAIVKELFLIDSTELTEINLKVFNPENLIVFDSVGDMEFQLENDSLTVVPRVLDESYSFSVNYYSDSLTSKDSETWLLEFSFILEPVIEKTLTLSLPPNTNLTNYSPQGIVYSDGEKIRIDWTKETLKDYSEFKAEYFFGIIPPEKNNYSILLFVAVLALVLLVIGFISVVVIKKLERTQFKRLAKKVEIEALKDELGLNQTQKDLMKTLSVNEELIVKELFANKALTQRKLLVLTGLPKSTLSRTIKSLQVKEFIKVKDHGLTNLISLNDWFLEK
ncbi:MAG: helix-turn-helix domain-containing protein [archaeon]